MKVELLINAWNSGTTFFYKMTTSEYEAWENAGFDENMAVSIMQAASSSDDGDSTSTNSISVSTNGVSNSNITDNSSASSGSSDSTTSSTSPVDDSATATDGNTAPQPVPQPPLAPLTTTFVNNNTVVGVNGQAVMVTKHSWKQRSDVGKPRKKST
ncbi:hypothetical protein K435DRAFT_856215 [Dendrothele bispora CBS 962.96]|uniref:Uncharacterized protein n=1 Tax=Dendrothele bispora (strain CBS 962.96) TaxID=1314807 RepID=A0A4S8M9P1_DENBC|nr:hypothetical protein K435DRAFT_856215 [Dendrothele bispora CBS 962.96]